MDKYMKACDLSQTFKHVIRSYKEWDKLTKYQQNALEEVIAYISLIMFEDHDHIPHWSGISQSCDQTVKLMEAGK